MVPPPHQVRAGFSIWSDLNRDILVSIAATDGVSMRDYSCLRGVCTAWRSALAPLSYPCLLSLAHGGSAFSLPMRRSFHVQESSVYGCGRGRRVIGSGIGRFAVAICWARTIFLVDPRAGETVQLVSPSKDNDSVRRIVFAPYPSPSPPRHDGDCTVVAVYDGHDNKVAYIDTGGSTDDDKWRTVGGTGRNYYTDMAFDAGGDKVYFLDPRRGVDVLRIPRGGEPAVVEPLATPMRDRIRGYAPPYDVVSSMMVAKHIFLCRGSLYQVWKNTSAAVSLGGGHLSMSANEIFVLRYHPGRWPCWDAVKGLGGCSVFISNGGGSVVVPPDVPEVRADYVYWINWSRVPMVCDIATGTSKPCVLPGGACKGDCWFFGDDDHTTSIHDDGRKLKGPTYMSI